MLVDEAPARASRTSASSSTTSRRCARGSRRPASQTRDATPLVGRPRFTCRDPFGNLVELARIEG